MAAILETLSTDLFYRFGWVLLHSLWQFALIAVLLAVAIETLRRRSAALRYIVCCVALASTIPAVIVTLCLDSRCSDRRSAANRHHIAAKTSADGPLPPAGQVEHLSKPEVSGEYIVSSDFPGETAVSAAVNWRHVRCIGYRPLPPEEDRWRGSDGHFKTGNRSRYATSWGSLERGCAPVVADVGGGLAWRGPSLVDLESWRMVWRDATYAHGRRARRPGGCQSLARHCRKDETAAIGASLSVRIG
jgi:hypothetical protein